MDSAEFSCSRRYAIGTLIGTPVGLLFPAALLTGSVWVLTLYYQGDKDVGSDVLFPAWGTLLAAIYMAIQMWQPVRYRHAL